MKIRNVAKAVIPKENSILLQQCRMPDGVLYYELPGGGQNPGETMEAAVVRECREETGYHVRVLHFLALLEEIVTDAPLVAAFPGYAHRIFYVFQCEITDTPKGEPSEEDMLQVALVWMDLEKLPALLFKPAALKTTLSQILQRGEAAYLGSDATDDYL